MPKYRKNLAYLVYVVILAALIFFIIKAFNSSSPSASTHPPASNKPTVSVSPKKKSSKASTQNQNLSNTGPGNVIELFIGASLIFGLLHYLSRLVRVTKT